MAVGSSQDHAKFSRRGDDMAEENTRRVLPTAMGFAAKEAVAASQ
jgi:hypothetical protein